MPLKIELWADGLGVDKKLFNDDHVRNAIREKDAHGAIELLSRLAEESGHADSIRALKNPANKLELLFLIESSEHK